ncbi:MAG: hypothetical protein AAGF12_10365 [Myxococcota bacterium]
MFLLVGCSISFDRSRLNQDAGRADGGGDDGSGDDGGRDDGAVEGPCNEPVFGMDVLSEPPPGSLPPVGEPFADPSYRSCLQRVGDWEEETLRFSSPVSDRTGNWLLILRGVGNGLDWVALDRSTGEVFPAVRLVDYAGFAGWDVSDDGTPRTLALVPADPADPTSGPHFDRCIVGTSSCETLPLRGTFSGALSAVGASVDRQHWLLTEEHGGGDRIHLVERSGASFELRSSLGSEVPASSQWTLSPAGRYLSQLDNEQLTIYDEFSPIRFETSVDDVRFVTLSDGREAVVYRMDRSILFDSLTSPVTRRLQVPFGSDTTSLRVEMTTGPPGWLFVSFDRCRVEATMDCDAGAQWAQDKIVALELEGDGRVVNLAWHRNRKRIHGTQSFSMARGADGHGLFFVSDWQRTREPTGGTRTSYPFELVLPNLLR